MTRSEMIARIAEQNPHFYAKDVEAAVFVIFTAMTDALTRGDRVELRNFGTFAPREIQARTGRNPRTGAVVSVDRKRHVHFKPSKAMRRRLNHGDAVLDQKVEQALQAS